MIVHFVLSCLTVYCYFLCQTVKVPNGVSAGDELTVQSPDGKQSVQVNVPKGLKSGDTFLVKLPPPSNEIEKAKSFEDVLLDSFLLPTPDTTTTGKPLSVLPGEPVNATVERAKGFTTRKEKREVPEDEARDIKQDRSRSFVDVIEDLITPNFPEEANKQEDRQEHDEFDGNHEHDDISAYSGRQKLLLVQVPPGVLPGSTIHVEIPGENRTVAAQVPPNTSSFHVAYTPRGENRAKEDASMYMMSHQAPAHASSKLVHENYTRMGQRLLLVRVPPGTPPGATLHVSVPDEPGRILAARVPPGNVKEFHVSYEARTQPTIQASRSMLPPADPYLHSSAYSVQDSAYPPSQGNFYPYARGSMPMMGGGGGPGAYGAYHGQYAAPQGRY